MSTSVWPEFRSTHRTGWVASCDLYDALDALELDQARYFNGRLIKRLYCGGKLFKVDFQHNLLETQILPIVEAVRFVLCPPTGYTFKHRGPKECPVCRRMAKRCGGDLYPLVSCTPCMLWMCRPCLTQHQDSH